MKKDLREALEKPFDKKFIKKRPGNFGKTLDYISGDVVIQRVNNVLEGNWSFEILNKPAESIVDGYVIVHGRVTIEETTNGEDGKRHWASTVSRDGYGTKKINRSKDGSLTDLGSDFKAASTDCFKKIMTTFGVALDLYGTDEKEDTEDSKPEVEAQPAAFVKASSIQLKAINSIGAAKKVPDLNAYATKTLGRDVVVLGDISESEAKKLITELNTYVAK